MFSKVIFRGWISLAIAVSIFYVTIGIYSLAESGEGWFGIAFGLTGVLLCLGLWLVWRAEVRRPFKLTVLTVLFVLNGAFILTPAIIIIVFSILNPFRGP